MDNNQVEVAALKEAQASNSDIVVLADVELLLVGGGVGEITPY